MDIYNASHKKDLTACEAIKNIAGKEPRPRTWPGLTYKIGEVLKLEYRNGVMILRRTGKEYR